MSSEVELKLEVDRDSARWVKQHPVLAPAGCRSQYQLTIYYDSPGGVLRRHGYSLRVRSAGGRFVQTVKPMTASAGLFARDEWETEVGSIEPDLGKLAPPLMNPALAGKLDRLGPIVRTEVERTSWQLHRGNSKLQVDLDEGAMQAGGRSQDFSELEFELLSGEPADIFAAAIELVEQVPLRIGVISKAERGFALAAGTLDKVSKAAPVSIGPTLSVAQAFEIIVHACLKHYRLNEPIVIERREAAALHQTRVAMRRLRSAFALFKPAVVDQDFERLRDELRWFNSQLGDARNLDVYLERELSDDDRQTLTGRRELAYDQAIGAMNSSRLLRLFIDLVEWVAVGSWRVGARSTKPIRDFTGRRLDRLWTSIKQGGPDIASMDEETRHQLRIQVKKMRYAIEFLGDVYPRATKKQTKFVVMVEGLQEALGKLNDLVTARSLATAAPENDWLVMPSAESDYLREAQRHFRRLAKIGPFWRTA